MLSLQVSNSPFNKDQADLLNQLLTSLSNHQKIWLSGYLASSLASTEADPAAQSHPSTTEEKAAATRSITILYGSHTGNCQSLAEQYKETLDKKGFETTLSALDDFKPKALKNVEDLLILTSTHGEGDPPDNALSFYEFIHGKRAPKLEGVRYSVLALGDSSYDLFCETGKVIDEKLAELGAERMYPRVDCDLDYEDPAEEWWRGVSQQLGSASETNSPAAAAAPLTDDVPVHSKSNPFQAEVLENINLNGQGSNKETRHLEIDLEGSGLTYEPGDSLGIYPQNEPSLVDALITEMNWDPEKSVSVNKQGEVRALREALLTHFEITVLTKPLLEKLAPFTSNESLADLLTDKEQVSQYIHGRDLLDFVKDYGPWEVDVDAFLTALRKIPVRLYSIASSLKANPDEVHLTVGALRYDSHGRKRTGVCSGQCAERTKPGDQLSVFVQKNQNFKLPEDTTRPIIMIGAGTGIAPYRSFMEEWEESEAEGKSWLFFGEQHFVTDFLYQTEWQKWIKDGVLTNMDVAFSRDTDQKVYVQHRLREKSKEVFQWIEEGAYLYICGDEKHMAKDVQETLLDIFQQEGAYTREEAENYLTELRKSKRYQRDVY